jgi:hypothetical protein
MRQASPVPSSSSRTCMAWGRAQPSAIGHGGSGGGKIFWEDFLGRECGREWWRLERSRWRGPSAPAPGPHHRVDTSGGVLAKHEVFGLGANLRFAPTVSLRPAACVRRAADRIPPITAPPPAGPAGSSPTGLGPCRRRRRSPRPTAACSCGETRYLGWPPAARPGADRSSQPEGSYSGPGKLSGAWPRALGNCMVRI